MHIVAGVVDENGGFMWFLLILLLLLFIKTYTVKLYLHDQNPMMLIPLQSWGFLLIHGQIMGDFFEEKQHGPFFWANDRELGSIQSWMLRLCDVFSLSLYIYIHNIT